MTSDGRNGPTTGYLDRDIQCVDCAHFFTWTAQDQEFYAEKNYSEPKRCKPCRLAKKEARAQGLTKATAGAVRLSRNGKEQTHE